MIEKTMCFLGIHNYSDKPIDCIRKNEGEFLIYELKNQCVHCHKIKTMKIKEKDMWTV